MDLSLISSLGPPAPSGQDAARVPWLEEDRDLIRSVRHINAAEMFGEGRELAFARDPETKRAVVRVIDQKTGEVLWQAPPEYMLRLAETLGHLTG